MPTAQQILLTKIQSHEELVHVWNVAHNQALADNDNNAAQQLHTNRPLLENPQEEFWALREFIRSVTNAYIPLPEELKPHFPYKLFVHVSQSDPQKIAYLPDNERDQIQDRQLVTRIGRLLNKLGVDNTKAARLSTLFHKRETSYNFHIYRNANDIEFVYEHGPDSCMARKSFESALHPARVYAAPNLGVAALKNTSETASPGNYFYARAVVTLNPPRWVRLYGNHGFDQVLRSELEARGFEFGANALYGEILANLTESTDPEDIIMPYLDGNHQDIWLDGNDLRVAHGDELLGHASAINGLLAPDEEEEDPDDYGYCHISEENYPLDEMQEIEFLTVNSYGGYRVETVLVADWIMDRLCEVLTPDGVVYTGRAEISYPIYEHDVDMIWATEDYIDMRDDLVVPINSDYYTEVDRCVYHPVEEGYMYRADAVSLYNFVSEDFLIESHYNYGFNDEKELHEFVSDLYPHLIYNFLTQEYIERENAIQLCDYVGLNTANVPDYGFTTELQAYEYVARYIPHLTPSSKAADL